MTIKRLTIFLTSVIALAVMVTPAFAGLDAPVWSDKTKGQQVIHWTSSFADFDYTVGGEIVMKICWNVDEGAAEFDSISFKRYTPKSKKDPADGNVPEVTTGSSSTCADVSFAFADLHCAKKEDVEIGNAHFKLYLNIDKNIDGTTDSIAGFGVNVHVEDPFDSGQQGCI